MVRYYVDTSIWRDLHENRTDKFRPLGEWAFEFFRMVRENNETVLYSDIVIEELLGDFKEEAINEIFKIVSENGLLEKVEIKAENLKEAVFLHNKLKIPRKDCLHAVLARDNNATMVTRDHHFEELQSIVDVKKPEELI